MFLLNTIHSKADPKQNDAFICRGARPEDGEESTVIVTSLNSEREGQARRDLAERRVRPFDGKGTRRASRSPRSR